MMASAQENAVKSAREKTRQLHDIMETKKAEYFAAKKTYESSVTQLFSVIDFGPDNQLALFPADPDQPANGQPVADQAQVKEPEAAADTKADKRPRKPAAKKVAETDWTKVKLSDAIAVGLVTNALEKLDPPVITLGGYREWLAAGNDLLSLPGMTTEKAELADQQFKEFWAKNPQFSS